LRERKLDAILSIRSNDAILGLPYDVFFFSMLQEVMAVELGVELGTYFHSAGSLHLYERHLRLAERTIAEGVFASPEMPEMPETESIASFLNFERLLRLSEGCGQLTPFQSDYWRELASVLLWQRERKRGASRDTLSSGAEGRYGALLKHLLEKDRERQPSDES
jgi:thymidylate synthase